MKKKTNDTSMTFHEWERIVFLALILLYLIPSFGILRKNWVNYSELASLTLCFVLMIVNHAKTWRKGSFLYYAIPIIMAGLMIFANLRAGTGDYKNIVIIVVASIIFKYPPSFSLPFLWFPLVAYLALSTVRLSGETDIFSMDFILGYILRNTITYLLIVFSIFLARKQLLLNDHLKALMAELKENREKLQEMGITRERTRIAREIHDTLGSTLTGAIIHLEAAKKYVPVNQEKAIESIERTQEITRQGFSEVKRAIKALRPIELSDNTLKEAIFLLKERIDSSYTFSLETCLNIPDEIDEDIKKNVFSIIRELVTNSIKHSGSDNLILTIDVRDDELVLYTHDNGRGCGQLVEGYGLTGIRERVGQLGGRVDYSSHAIEGFQTLIRVPLG